MHYRTQCCGSHEPIKLSKEDDILSGLTESYIRQLFDDRGVSDANKKKLWQHYYTTLSKGITGGYNPKPESYDPALSHSLKYNVAQFSAFKETSFRKQLESELTKNGKVVPWSEFKKKADILNIDYNRKWLKTEYDHTVATANMAEKWQEFEADKDLYPNLKYVTAGDARVRDSHKILDGLILPINDPFWKTHLTPNDWGCRCDVIQSDEPVSKTIPDLKVKPVFENNAALSGKIFGEMPYAAGLTSAEIKAAEKLARQNFENSILQKPRNEQFNLKFEKGKGKVLEHLLIKKGDDYNDILKVATEYAKKGKVAELLPEIYKDEVAFRNLILPNLISKTSNPDLRIGSLFYDIKRPTAIKNILGNANAASNQAAIAVISDSQLDKFLTDKIMLERAKDIFNDSTYQFDEVVFIRGNELFVFNRTGDK